MALEIAREKHSGGVYTVEIGATQAAGGTRGHTVRIGGETTLPFMFEEGDIPNAPQVALEIFDCEPADWPDTLKDAFGPCVKDPIKWAKRCVSDFGAKLLCVRLMSVHDDYGARPIDESVGLLKSLLREVKAPFIVIGCGDAVKDSDLLAKASQAAKNEKCLFGLATQNDYKTLTASALADGHSVIAESPIDVNIAKQVNILISDMALAPERIVMHPTTASLGYGMEYAFSIMERSRLAALAGDKMLSMPFILFTGQEVWRVREAKESPSLGAKWESATAAAMLHAGADLIVMRHPEAALKVTKFIDILMKGRKR